MRINSDWHNARFASFSWILQKCDIKFDAIRVRSLIDWFKINLLSVIRLIFFSKRDRYDRDSAAVIIHVDIPFSHSSQFNKTVIIINSTFYTFSSFYNISKLLHGYLNPDEDEYLHLTITLCVHFISKVSM
jgi:hypothetical protein